MSPLTIVMTLLTIGFFLGLRVADLGRPLRMISGAAETASSALGVAASSSSTGSSSDATSSCDCGCQCRLCDNTYRLLTIYFLRGFRFLLPDAIVSSIFVAVFGVAVPAVCDAPVPLVAAFLELSPETREIRRRFGVSSSCRYYSIEYIRCPDFFLLTDSSSSSHTRDATW